MFDESLLDGMERLAAGQPFDRPHGLAPDGFERKLAGLDGLLVDEHGAGPAVAFAAAEFRSGQAEIGSQHPKQGTLAVGFDAHGFSVEGEGDGFDHGRSSLV